jgi:hypothetical protein
MADRQSKDYLAGAPVFESYLKMSLPVVAGLLISLIYTIVDIYFISLTGETELMPVLPVFMRINPLLVFYSEVEPLNPSIPSTPYLTCFEDFEIHMLYE